MMISRVVNLSYCTLLLLLSTVTPTDECIKEMCDKTLLIPAVEDWSIELPPCDVCTDCPTLPQTKHAWWYYRWPNGSQTAGFTAEVMDNRNYVVNLLGHPSLVTPRGSHTIYTNYFYLCDGIPGVLYDIEITLTPVGATLECRNEMPVSEGSSVVIWCETGLPDSRNTEIAFHFYGRRGECPPAVLQASGGHSNWMANRNESEPYTCGLYIQNMQPSDSGDYYCEVSVPSTNITVKSSSLYIEVASPNPVEVPLEISIPVAAGGGLLILVLSVMLVACFVVRRCWIRPVDGDQIPLIQGQGQHGPGAENHQQGYGASGSTVAAAGVIGPTDSVISRPDEMSESFTDEGKQSETTNV